MKVRDAIKQLKKLDPEIEIFANGYDGTYHEATEFEEAQLSKTNNMLGSPFEVIETEEISLKSIILGQVGNGETKCKNEQNHTRTFI